MDDEIKAWLARFRADISLQLDKVLDRQSLLIAKMDSLEATVASVSLRVDRIKRRLYLGDDDE